MSAATGWNKLRAGWHAVALRGPSFIRAFRDRRSVRSIVGACPDASVCLKELDQCAGDEFVLLAEALGAMDMQLSELGTKAAELDNLLEGRGEERAHDSAFALYKRSVDLVHSSIGIALSQEEELTSLETRLLKDRQHFSENNTLYRVLGLNFRAEAARVDAENRAIFNTVASDMSSMETRKNKTIETVFSELEAIISEALVGRQQLMELVPEAIRPGANPRPRLERRGTRTLNCRALQSDCHIARQVIVTLPGKDHAR